MPIQNPTGADDRSSSSADRIFLGLSLKQRLKIYFWLGVVMVFGFLVWVWIYLQPDRWYKYTDQVAFEQVAEDVELGHVLWAQAGLASGGLESGGIREPAISSDGARMVYSNEENQGNADLFIRRWDGTEWGQAVPLRALNSNFRESAPALSGDGKFLYFVSDRPGGRGGNDIWVARWDGVEYAWPLPLTGRVNSAFDEIDPALSADGLKLYFASDRPPESADRTKATTASFADIPTGKEKEKIEKLRGDFDLYAADIAGDTPFDLYIERQLSMLYSLREGALSDMSVMEKLGGSRQTESAVDKGLEFLAKSQEADGRWSIARHGGQGGHDVAATSFALLAFYGRGERHDRECKYRDNVARGLKWLISQQNRASGDLRGNPPPHNGMYDHGAAALALVEAYGVTKDSQIRPRAHAALEFISESQHEGGGWRYQPNEQGDLSVSGWMVMALASGQMSGIPVPQKTLDGVAKFLDFVRGGQHGGSYGYTNSPGKRNSGKPALDAVGFFCAQLAGFSPNHPRSYESSALLGQVGFRLSDVYYVYYATLANYQHQGPVWRQFREKMQAGFVGAQQKDGAWQPRGGHGGAMGKVVGTALVVLCLEAHYRYSPLYGLGYEPHPDGPVEGVLDQKDLPPTPLFRHAKYLDAFSSPGDDTAPVVTEHGDFLYFDSNREGGFGGSDIYRARISGKLPGAPENLGAEINSEANETNPAVRMAGFHLLFNSDRGGEKAGALYSSMSRRVFRRYDYGKLPSMGWAMRNLHWILILSLSTLACVWFTRRALMARKQSDPPAPMETPGSDSSATTSTPTT